MKSMQTHKKLFFLFWFICSSEMKCLKDYPDIPYEKNFYLDGMSLPIVIETSSRASHLFISSILQILLTDVLKYKSVKSMVNSHPADHSAAISRLTNLSEDGIPQSMVNLEVWLTHGVELNSKELVDAGPLGPIGMFSWFVPTYEVNKFWESSVVVLDHWKFLTVPNVTRLFALDSHLRAVESELVSSSQNEKTLCENIYKHCQRGILTVNKTLCHGIRNNSCALLVSSFPDLDKKLIVEQIQKFNIRARVAWIGDNLAGFVSKMAKSNQPVLFFNWIPNDVTSISSFQPIHFPSHFTYDKEQMHEDFIYRPHTLKKLVWKVVKSHLPEVYHVVSRFNFSQHEIELELSKFPLNWNKIGPENTVQQLACDWLKRNVDKWQSWIPANAVKKTPVYLVGLFQNSQPSLREGALMAVEMLNGDELLLRDYELVLLTSEVSCENVIDGFLNAVMNETHPVAAFIGPSCSEAVDSLSSPSKYFNKLVISFGSDSWNDRKASSSFFDVVPGVKHVKDVYTSIFKSQNWSQVALISQDEDTHEDRQDSLKQMLISNSIDVTYHGRFTRAVTTENAYNMIKLLNSSSTKFVILVSADGQLVLKIICLAHKMEVSSSYGYVWFLPHQVTHLDWTAGSVDCTSSELLQALKGSFIVQPSLFGFPDELISLGGISVREWIDLYHARMDALDMKTSGYGGYVFDAVLSFGLALDSLLHEDPSCVESLYKKSTIGKLSSHLSRLKFTGTTGLVWFEDVERIGSFDIKQVQENGSLQAIGAFHSSTNSSKQLFLNDSSAILKSELFLRSVLTTTLCNVERLRSFLNVDCEMAIIIINIFCFTLLLVSVLGCLIAIKRRYDVKVRATCQRMEELGLFSQDTSWLCLDQWEVPRDNVVLNRKLGEGAFGTVFGGEANIEGTWMAAAVKTLKISSKPDEKLNFLSEAEMMKRFNHENIVKLLGVCTRGEPTLTVMEFMLHGDLKTFLLSRRQLVGQQGREAEDVSPFQLTKMALDVAHGLLYLSSLNYVHRDLACRNCLVHASKTVKIGDFGMTRSMNDSDYYRFNKRGMFPVRWMAPESLSDGLFGTASDVWSFGILLYEVITFGSFPYQGLSNRQVLNFVKSGNILSMPVGCPPKMESLLKRCWAFDPKSRPKVMELLETLTEMSALLIPCLDTPSTSVNEDGPWSLEMNLLPRVRHRNQYQKNLLICDRMSAPAPATASRSAAVSSLRLSSPPFCLHVGGEGKKEETVLLSSFNLSSQEKDFKSSDLQSSGTIIQCEMDESFMSQDTTHLCHANICSDSKVKDGCLISVRRSLSADDKALFDERQWNGVSTRICRLYTEKIMTKIEGTKKTEEVDCPANQNNSVKRRTLLPSLSGPDEQEGFATEPRQNNRKSIVGPQQLTCDSRTDSDYCSQHSKDFSAHLGTTLL